MKIQELLNKHKDKLWDWLGELIIDWLGELIIDLKARENYQTIVIDLRINDEPTAAFSLADLLFDTPFLSLLEWEKWDSDFVTYDYDIYWILSPTTRRLSTHEHHKINLVLLSNDEERISYLENNTI